jgi:hypothetical protein
MGDLSDGVAGLLYEYNELFVDRQTGQGSSLGATQCGLENLLKESLYVMQAKRLDHRVIAPHLGT